MPLICSATRMSFTRDETMTPTLMAMMPRRGPSRRIAQTRLG